VCLPFISHFLMFFLSDFFFCLFKTEVDLEHFYIENDFFYVEKVGKIYRDGG